MENMSQEIITKGQGAEKEGLDMVIDVLLEGVGHIKLEVA